jgi:hypothetical protein
MDWKGGNEAGSHQTNPSGNGNGSYAHHIRSHLPPFDSTFTAEKPQYNPAGNGYGNGNHFRRFPSSFARSDDAFVSWNSQSTPAGGDNGIGNGNGSHARRLPSNLPTVDIAFSTWHGWSKSSGNGSHASRFQSFLSPTSNAFITDNRQSNPTGNGRGNHTGWFQSNLTPTDNAFTTWNGLGLDPRRPGRRAKYIGGMTDRGFYDPGGPKTPDSSLDDGFYEHHVAPYATGIGDRVPNPYYEGADAVITSSNQTQRLSLVNSSRLNPRVPDFQPRGLIRGSLPETPASDIGVWDLACQTNQNTTLAASRGVNIEEEQIDSTVAKVINYLGIYDSPLAVEGSAFVEPGELLLDRDATPELPYARNAANGSFATYHRPGKPSPIILIHDPETLRAQTEPWFWEGEVERDRIWQRFPPSLISSHLTPQPGHELPSDLSPAHPCDRGT